MHTTGSTQTVVASASNPTAHPTGIDQSPSSCQAGGVNGSANPLGNFGAAALEWAAGSDGQLLVDAAAEALVEGVDSLTLRMLAGAPRASADEEANELAPRVFEELGLSIPERLSSDAMLAVAPLRAAACLRGDITPRDLAAQMWRIYITTDYATELDGFASFDDAYDLVADGSIPGHSEHIDADVLAAARRLVDTGSSVVPSDPAAAPPAADVEPRLPSRLEQLRRWHAVKRRR